MITINGTTGIAGANGSASTPAVQGEDTNTGMFFPAADTVAVATGGSERMRIDASGNVGIGTSSPTAGFRLHAVSSGGSNVIASASSDASGVTTYMQANGSTSGIFGTLTNHPQVFVTNNTERARIDASGNLLVGTTTAGFINDNGWAKESVSVVQRHNSSQTSGTAYTWFTFNTSAIGSITQSGTTGVAYNTTSDHRLKENVAPMQNALDTVAQLNPVTYTWKADGSAGQGFIAHELQAVVPDCVTGEKDAVDAEGNPQYQGVDTSFLVATLVKAIQELTARVAQLEAQ